MKVCVPAMFAIACSQPPAPSPARIPTTTQATTSSAPIALDPAIRTGRLPNGIPWVIAQTTDDAADFDLPSVGLVVFAGSHDETDDQTGAAQVVFQIARGTDHYDRSYIGAVEPGLTFLVADNQREQGRTTIDVIDRALASLRSKLTKTAITRGAIARATSREHPGAEEQVPAVMLGMHAERHRTAVSRKQLAALDERSVGDYFRAWYRSDNIGIAVIVDEDVDIEDVKSQISLRFGKLAPPRQPIVRAKPPALPDKLAITPQPTKSIEVAHWIPRRRVVDEASLRADLLDQLVGVIVAVRWGGYGGAWVAEVDEARALDVVTAERGGELEDLRQLVVEIERLRVHGALAEDLTVAKPKIEDRIDDHPPSLSELAQFLRDGTVPEGPSRAAAARRILAAITVDDVTAHARETLQEQRRVIAFDATSSEVAIRAAATIDPSMLAPWNSRDAARTEPAPARGTLSAPKQIAIGDRGETATEWRASNGARFVLIPSCCDPYPSTAPRTLAAFGPGGWARTSADVAEHARVAVDVVAATGLGTWNTEELRAITREAAVEIAGAIEAHHHALVVKTTVRNDRPPQQLEKMFQLMHLAIARPRVDAKAFDAWRTARKAKLVPVPPQYEQLRVASGDTPTPPLDAKVLDRLKPAEVLDAYRNELGDIANMTFVLFAAERVEVVQPLVETYLASLTPSGTRMATVARSPARPAMPGDQTVRNAPSTRIELSFLGARVTAADRATADVDVLVLARMVQARIEHMIDFQAWQVYAAGRIADSGERVLYVWVWPRNPAKPPADDPVPGVLAAMDHMHHKDRARDSLETAILARLTDDVVRSQRELLEAIEAVVGRGDSWSLAFQPIKPRITSAAITATVAHFNPRPVAIVRYVH